MRRALFAVALFFAGLFAAATARGAETLRDVLTQRGVPAAQLSARTLDQNITSYAVLSDDDGFVIAYYVDDGSGKLQPPLRVARYSKHDSRWTEAAISREEAKLPKETVDCLGSALNIHHLGEYFLIDTHLGPSSGCVLMLSVKLKVMKSLDGWFVGGLLSRIVVFHESMVQFAPTQPMRIKMYDPAQEKVSASVRSFVPVNTLYPPPQDPYRAKYTEKLRPLVGDKAWCNAHNSPCDPEDFNSDLTKEGTSGASLVATSDASQGIAFVVGYSPVGLVPDEIIKKTPELKQDVVYVYRLSDKGFGYREFPLDEMQDTFGVSTVQELVDPPVLDKVFASATQ